MRAALSALVAVIVSGAPVRADSGSAVAAALFEEGRAAMEAQDYATACEKFRASDAMEPSPGAKLNWANCEEKRGQLAAAWQKFHDVAALLPENDERLEIARSREAALAPRVPKLVVRLARGAPPDTRVTLDGVDLPSGALGSELPVEPGRHTLVATAPGRSRRTFDVRLREGEHRALLAAPSPSLVVPAAEEQPGARTAAGGGIPPLAYAAGGLGVAGVAVGAIAGALALGKKQERDDHCDAAKQCDAKGLAANDAVSTLSTVSTVGWIVGAIGIGGGTYLLVTASPKTQAASGHGAVLTMETAW